MDFGISLGWHVGEEGFPSSYSAPCMHESGHHDCAKRFKYTITHNFTKELTERYAPEEMIRHQ